MLNIITEILVLIMFVSGVGSFLTLRPAYEIRSKTQKKMGVYFSYSNYCRIHNNIINCST